MDAFGEKNKNKKINMEWRGSLHTVSVGGPGGGHRVLPTRDVLGHTKRERAARRASRLAQATSTGLSFALLKKWVVDLVLEGKRGATKSKGVRTNSPGQVVLVQNKRPSRSRLATLSSALPSHDMPARRARALPAEAGSGVGQTMCCC